jgi:hypothetical protein
MAAAAVCLLLFMRNVFLAQHWQAGRGSHQVDAL